MKKNNDRKINELVKKYNTVVKIVDSSAKKQTDRAYGGFVRSTKGFLQEEITEELIRIAWNELGGNNKRIKINSKKMKIPIKKIKIPIKTNYVNNIKDKDIKKYIKSNIKNYFFSASVDKHVFIDDKFVLGIECKAYTENAMIKRILVDFTLLKTKFPKLKCFLFQIESQLTGDYSELKKITYGSTSTHTLMSYFENVDLEILTLVKGERKVKKPIHKDFKPLPKESLIKAVDLLKESLKEFK